MEINHGSSIPAELTCTITRNNYGTFQSKTLNYESDGSDASISFPFEFEGIKLGEYAKDRMGQFVPAAIRNISVTMGKIQLVSFCISKPKDDTFKNLNSKKNITLVNSNEVNGVIKEEISTTVSRLKIIFTLRRTLTEDETNQLKSIVTLEKVMVIADYLEVSCALFVYNLRFKPPEIDITKYNRKKRKKNSAIIVEPNSVK